MSKEDTAPSDIARRLASLSTSIVADASAGKGVLSPGLLRFSGSGTVAGPAITADCAEGSVWAVFATLDRAHPGDVLLMTAPGSTAYLGDLLANNIANRGVAAVVVDGLIRDKDAVANMHVSIFARGVTPAARRGHDPGISMAPVHVGDVQVNPGDWIVADSDGVVVIPPQDVEAVLVKAEENERIEKRIMARIKAGANVMDAVNAELGR